MLRKIWRLRKILLLGVIALCLANCQKREENVEFVTPGIVVAVDNIAPVDDGISVESFAETGAKETVSDPVGYEKCTVLYVVDGDTIRVSLHGEEKPVRLIGVNTPESSAGVKSGYVDEEEFYGNEASDFTKSILKAGDTVWLIKDQSGTDKYDRLLRIVWLKEPLENELHDIDAIRQHTLQGVLLSNGYAETMAIEPDITYKEIFTALQSEAMRREAGMWHFTEQHQ